MIVRIDFYDHHQDVIDKVYTWLRVDRSYWQGPNHRTVITEEHFLDHIRGLVTYRPPPTPEERARQVCYDMGAPDQSVGIYQSFITKAIEDAIAADREAR